MIERSVYRNALWIITAIALVAAAVFLLMDFTLPKDFADVVPHTQQFDSCKITCITIDSEGEVTLTGEEFTNLMDLLQRVQYHKRGSYGGVMEGTIYHLAFFSSQGEHFQISVSDLGNVYIGSHYYETTPNTISEYLEVYLAE